MRLLSIPLRVGTSKYQSTKACLLNYVVMMAVARNVGDACSSIKAGKWERSRLVGVEAKGKTLAIVGLGKGKIYG